MLKEENSQTQKSPAQCFNVVFFDFKNNSIYIAKLVIFKFNIELS